MSRRVQSIKEGDIYYRSKGNNHYFIVKMGPRIGAHDRMIYYFTTIERDKFDRSKIYHLKLSPSESTYSTLLEWANNPNVQVLKVKLNLKQLSR